MGKFEKQLDRRRRDLLRMRAKARRIYPHDPKGRLANHLAACSCCLCGNPRLFGKRDRLTLQEKRARDADEDGGAG